MPGTQEGRGVTAGPRHAFPATQLKSNPERATVLDRGQLHDLRFALLGGVGLLTGRESSQASKMYVTRCQLLIKELVEKSNAEDLLVGA